jgi:hypothetical protein
VSSWKGVTCRACPSAGFPEVVVASWKIYPPEQNAERVQLLLESLAAFSRTGREPWTIRCILRSLLTQNLETLLPDDEQLRGLPIRRFRARPRQIVGA